MFSLLVFSLALVQYFPTIPVLFGIRMSMLWVIYWKIVICFMIERLS